MGALLEDAYELGGVAGAGRTTRVRLAVRRVDCQPVAIKRLRSEHQEHPERRRRFLQQGNLARMLTHDAIEHVHDVLDLEDGATLVTEWVDGRSLQRLAAGMRAAGTPWKPNVVALVARTLLEALRHAHHQQGGFEREVAVHGGITPRNVMIDADGTIKLVDFGMASVWQEGREPWQDLEALRYLSADHMRHGATPGSDLYAVGAIVHELLDGRRFRDRCETEAEMRAAIDSLEPPGKPFGDIPLPLERLRRRLLEPANNPRVTLEHMLDLCAAVPIGDAPGQLRRLVREALRDDSTQPDAAAPPDDVARSRERPQAAWAHAASEGRLQPPALGHAPRTPGRRDTQSVPVPVDHEQTKPRRPMYLDQTAPPVSEAARDAERRRSGADDSEPAAPHDIDTVPLPAEIGAPESIEDPEPAPVPPYSDELDDPETTAEVDAAPRVPLDGPRRRSSSSGHRASVPRPGPRPAWMRGPVGWAMLGALAVVIGLPLAARCVASDPSPTGPARPPGASARPAPGTTVR